MRRAALPLVLVALAGCSREKAESLPVACQDATAVEEAMKRAPEPVEVDGRLLSECFPRDANGGDVQLVGTTFNYVAGRLADRRDAIRLGYLVGAARRGAERSQSGIYAELLRRLENELDLVDTGTPAFGAAERAGRERG
ncbi:MAG: hypothetical protein H0T15_09895 [Thermoleophilaceae bacterium]|nr:hypothetical protein [Thermoleophilaceae bacterium]